MPPSHPLTILHFNDVYELNPRNREPVGGAARLATRIREHAADNPLILFSGDAFNPSLLSTITKGKQMVEVLNQLGVHASAMGNHDLDYGLESFVSLSRQCSFPWLLSNVDDRQTGEPLGGCKRTLMVEWQGWRVGLMGLVEPEWLETLPSVDPEALLYTDFVAQGRQLAKDLQAQGADIVIALTHMRLPNDRVLAAEAPEVDLILGGHDHDYSFERSLPHKTLLVKSGTDFRDLSVLTLTLRPLAPHEAQHAQHAEHSQQPQVSPLGPPQQPAGHGEGQLTQGGVGGHEQLQHANSTPAVEVVPSQGPDDVVSDRGDVPAAELAAAKPAAAAGATAAPQPHGGLVAAREQPGALRGSEGAEEEDKATKHEAAAPPPQQSKALGGEEGTEEEDEAAKTRHQKRFSAVQLWSRARVKGTLPLRRRTFERRFEQALHTVGSTSLSLAGGAANKVADLATGAASVSVSVVGSSASKVVGLASGAASLVRRGSSELLSSLARMGSSEHLGAAGTAEEGGAAGAADEALAAGKIGGSGAGTQGGPSVEAPSTPAQQAEQAQHEVQHAGQKPAGYQDSLAAPAAPAPAIPAPAADGTTPRTAGTVAASAGSVAAAASAPPATSGDRCDRIAAERVCGHGGALLVAECRHLGITSEIPEDPEMQAIVEKYNSLMGASMEEVVGYTAVPLDGRFSSVRTSETNLGNFICDVLRAACHCDAVLMNSGTFRSDAIHSAGRLTNGDLMAILPMMDETCVIEVTGRQLLAALENGVSQYPALEGRFPQVSGIDFAFDPSKPPRSRVEAPSVMVNGTPLRLDAPYSLATKAYLAKGHDGYESFKGCPLLLDAECAPMLPTAVRCHLLLLAVLNKWVDPPTWRVAANRLLHLSKSYQQSLAEKAATEGASAGASTTPDASSGLPHNPGGPAGAGSANSSAAQGRAAGLEGRSRPRGRNAVRNPITKLYEIAPAVEGRIRNLAEGA